MNTRTQLLSPAITLLVLATLILGGSHSAVANDPPSASNDQQAAAKQMSATEASAVFAGGCFWCIEADFEKLEGVIDVVSGYTGGSAETANYKTVSYTETGHFEAVKVSYDPAVVSYSELVEYFWRHIDPTDPNGQFCDKGSSYKSAIFYSSDEEQSVVDDSLATLAQSKPFSEPIVTEILPAKPFYLAEDYHQNYYLKNPWRYKYYRNGCGRDKRVAELWGENSR